MANYKRGPYKKRLPRLHAVATEELPALTVKQENFVNYLMQGKSGSEAYRAAYKPKRLKDEHVSHEAWALKLKPQVAKAIRFRQRIGLDNCKITLENHAAELARLREEAVEAKQISAGVQAEHYRGRISGLYQDNVNLRVGPSDEMLLSQIMQLLGEDTAIAIAEGLGQPKLLENKGE